MNIQTYRNSSKRDRKPGMHNVKKPNMQLQLTAGPVLMIGGLLAKLLCQVVQPLKPTDLCKEPLLVAFLSLLQALPCTGYIL